MAFDEQGRDEQSSVEVPAEGAPASTESTAAMPADVGAVNPEAAVPGAEDPAVETVAEEVLDEVTAPIAEVLADVAPNNGAPMAAAPIGDTPADVVPAPESALTATPAKPGFTTRISDSVKRNPSRWALWTTLVLLLVVGFFWPNVPAPHVQLGGEPAFPNGPTWVTNSLLLTFIVDAVLILLALAATTRMKLVPSGLQNFVEMTVEYFWGLSEQVAGKAARTYFPWIMTIFLLIIFSNWSGMIPGVGSIGWEVHDATHAAPAAAETGSRFEAQLAMADGNLILLSPAATTVAAPVAAEAEAAGYFVPLFRAPSADLNLTLTLAIITMFMVQFWGVRALGGSYFRKFFTFSGKGFMRYINAFVGILELISELSRIISFSFRLYGNIFAGEIVLATMAFLGAFLLPVPFYVLELFVGFVQALVFTMLALVFFSMATQGHHDDSHAEAH